MQQVVIIGGGDTFKTREDFLHYLKTRPVTIENFIAKTDWKASLQNELGKNFLVLTPQMPNKHNADYMEWKTWFTRLIPFLNPGVILIGHSLGGVFLAKYLAKEGFVIPIQKLMLVAAPYPTDKQLCSFASEASLAKLPTLTKEIHIFHSTDDVVVPITNAHHYKAALPQATLHIFTSMGHINTPTFPLLVEVIKHK